MKAPTKLSCHPQSPHYKKIYLDMVDKVFVDGVHIPTCFAYDMDEGWAFSKLNGVWQPKVYGEVTVKMKGTDDVL